MGPYGEGEKNCLNELELNGVSKKARWYGFSGLLVGLLKTLCFNKALLEKQCWRMWTKLDSLMARILKAKYFPNCSILEAQQGRKLYFYMEKCPKLV